MWEGVVSWKDKYWNISQRRNSRYMACVKEKERHLIQFAWLLLSHHYLLELLTIDNNLRRWHFSMWLVAIISRAKLVDKEEGEEETACIYTRTGRTRALDTANGNQLHQIANKVYSQYVLYISRLKTLIYVNKFAECDNRGVGVLEVSVFMRMRNRFFY
jgi:hypothetical protein